jgi:hypothetical protein
MRTRIFKSILLIGLIISFFNINAQIEKLQAVDLVMENVIKEDSVNFNVLIYPELIHGSEYKLSNFHSLHSPYDNAWLFFIDMVPKAQWDHDCKYLFVDQQKGEITEIKHRIPPNNYWRNWEFVNYPFPYPAVLIPSDSIMAINYITAPDPHKYAVLLCWNEEEPFRWPDLSHIYCGIKRNYGFMDENIFVLSGSGVINPDSVSPNLDGDLIYPDFDGPCKKDSIEAVFNHLKYVMTNEDILFVYATTHGETKGQNLSFLRLWDYDTLYDYELASLVADIECSQKIFCLDACYSGGFVDNLEGDHTIIQTCVDGQNPSWIGTEFGFTDMSLWWGTAIRGYYPKNKLRPWEDWFKIGENDSLFLISNIDSTDYNPDSDSGNADGFIQFQEAFNFAHHYAADIRDRNGQNYINHGFRGDLLTLNGIEGRVDTTQSIVGNYLIGRKLTLALGVTLSEASNYNHHLNIFLNDSSEILVEDGADLDIACYFSDFVGCSGKSKITVLGDLSPTKMYFSAYPGAEILLDFNNTESQYALDHFKFVNTNVSGICDSLSFSLCNFENSTIDFSGNKLNIFNNNNLYNAKLNFTGNELNISQLNQIDSSEINISSGNATIDYENDFSNSSIDVSNPRSLSSSCTITGNSFENTSTIQSINVITIEDYTNFLIENNSIEYDEHCGIGLFYAGLDERGEHAIRNNNPIRFTGTGIPLLAELGIHSYFSNGLIENNHIDNNDFGISGFHQSNLSVMGESSAQYEENTQVIEDNTISQCIFSYSSFPYEFQYNVLRDESLENKPFIQTVEYDLISQDTNLNRGMNWDTLHVEYNCWVNDTNPSDRLIPSGKYSWRPTWCPGEGHLKSADIPGTLYEQALNNIDEGYYLEAESGFKQIIAEYPKNNFAQASLKGLFSLNPAIHDTDYTYIKAYCDSLAMNPGDSLLGKSAEWLSIHCNIRDMQYQLAVNSLDSIIFNPGTLADSVFAMIDLCKVFSLMNETSGSKSALYTRHPDIIPESREKYITQRKEWIDLLLRPAESQTQGIDTLGDQAVEEIPARILAVYPNPTDGSFTIRYSSTLQGAVRIQVLSITGQALTDMNFEINSPGEYQHVVNNNDLPAGIYFVVLSVNGLKTDAEKLLSMK